MKISAVPRGAGGQESVNPNAGQSASAEKIARAKAIVSGQPAPQAVEAPVQETTHQKLRRIRMNTNATPAGREWAPPEPAAAVATEPAAAHIPDTTEPATAASEENKPLSPQFAALAKQRRALQIKESEIAAREAALKQTSQSTTDATAMLERIKADPLGFLGEHGIDNERLTQEVIKSMEGGGPALTRVESELRKELKGLKEAFDAQTKTQDEIWTNAQNQEFGRMQKQADQIIATDDSYQMIRDTKSNADVSKLIQRVLLEEGELLDIKDAMDLIENDLLEDSLRYARIEKVQKALQPAPAPQQLQPAAPQDGIRRQTMRTLTNRDTVSSIPSRRERAIAAALGRKLA